VDGTYESLRERLANFGQEHVLAFWHEITDDRRRQLSAQIDEIDLQRLGSLVRGTHEAEDWQALARRAVAPPAVRLADRHPLFSPQQARARGQQALAAGQVGVILVAGGQGTRLGLDHPKGIFSIGPVSGASLFQILVEKVIAQARAAHMRIPLYLMTSPATHQETLDYLAQRENFGLPSEDLHVFCQGTMPAVDAASGRLLLADKHCLALSPDGHGGMLRALVASGGLADMRRRGVKELFYCQVDNPLVPMCDPEFLGYHLLSDSELSTQVVAKRTPRDRVGNVVSIDGKLRIIEYSDLNPLDDATVTRASADGSPVFWAGNTAVHVFDTAFLERMSQSGTALPFHLARKAVGYVDSAGHRIEPREANGIKFERFIFDLLPQALHAIVVEVDEAQTFAPVKNASGEPRDTPETVRAQMIALHASWLCAVGCEVPASVAVEISPLFAQNAEELAAKVGPGVVVTQPRYFC
jgi:UDP-N-acetylglucosamine/UDP-N-acetylgalactosamine diphosphorylase